MTDKNKLVILGSGAAGWTAAIYAARANLNPVVITGDEAGGQLMVTNDVENYPGFAEITGPELMDKIQKHAEKFGTQVIYDHIKQFEVVQKNGKNNFIMHGAKITYHASAVIIATGARAKWLGLSSETKYIGAGVSGCATCDGFFFKGKIVAVIGGGNTALEEALFLTNFASKVYLIHRRDQFKAEKILQDRVQKNSKIEVIWNHKTLEIIGNDSPKKVTGLRLESMIDQKIKELELDGVFIAIGHEPNSQIFKDIVGLNIDSNNYLVTEAGSTKTGVDGLFAAGDIQDHVYRQAITSAGTGCMAALDAEKYLAENVTD